MISVIIPVYNASEYLPYCLDSILASSYGDLEVICVNDGSRDDSLSILERYARADSRVKVLDKENGGVCTARNLGLDHATGEWVAFLDADDAFQYHYLEVMVKAAEQFGGDDVDVVASTCDGWHEHGAMPDYREESADYGRARLLGWKQIRAHNIVCANVCARIYKRNFIGNLRFAENLHIGEDTCFNLIALNSKPNLKLVGLDWNGYLYRLNTSSSSNTRSLMCGVDSMEYLMRHVPSFPSRAGRIVCCEYAMGITVGISKRVQPEEQRRCRWFGRMVARYWLGQGFVSWANAQRFMLFAFCVHLPKLYRRLRGLTR